MSIQLLIENKAFLILYPLAEHFCRSAVFLKEIHFLTFKSLILMQFVVICFLNTLVAMLGIFKVQIYF